MQTSVVASLAARERGKLCNIDLVGDIRRRLADTDSRCTEARQTIKMLIFFRKHARPRSLTCAPRAQILLILRDRSCIVTESARGSPT